MERALCELFKFPPMVDVLGTPKYSQYRGLHEFLEKYRRVFSLYWTLKVVASSYMTGELEKDAEKLREAQPDGGIGVGLTVNEGDSVWSEASEDDLGFDLGFGSNWTFYGYLAW